MAKSKESEEGKNALHCAFCGKSQHEVQKMIAGPSVCICNECVNLCREIISEDDGFKKEIVLQDEAASIIMQTSRVLASQAELSNLCDDLRVSLKAFGEMLGNEEPKTGASISQFPGTDSTGKDT